MKIEQILQLVNAVSESDLTEFKFEGDDVKLSLKKTSDKIVQVPEVQPVVPNVTAVKETVQKQENNAEKVSGGNIVKSPLVGTFYAAPAEDADPFVKAGDEVKEGQVLAIVEAMKLMNEIESDFSGTVAEILVENGQAVEYGQPLFVIR